MRANTPKTRAIAVTMRGETAAGTRCRDLARNRRRLADAASARAPHEIHMNVIVVIDIGAGRQHGGELIAGCRLHVVQEALLLRRAVPAILHLDHVAVGEIEFGDVERIAESVLGNMRVRTPFMPRQE